MGSTFRVGTSYFSGRQRHLELEHHSVQRARLTRRELVVVGQLLLLTNKHSLQFGCRGLQQHRSEIGNGMLFLEWLISKSDPSLRHGALERSFSDHLQQPLNPRIRLAGALHNESRRPLWAFPAHGSDFDRDRPCFRR